MLQAVAWAVLCLASGSCKPLEESRSAAPPRPNIVLILADDMGFSDIGAYGGEIHTPHLDALAESGLRFTQFYNTARCTPSRASLLTGLYPHQAGLGYNPDSLALPIRETFNNAAYQDHLAYETPTMAEVLREAGYAAYMTGKWHLGYDRPQWPVDRGFDRSFSTIEGAYNYYGYGIQMLRQIREPQMALDGRPFTPPREGFYTTDAYTNYAVQFIREHDGARPFFLYVAYNAPHWPLQAPEEDIAKYRGAYAKGWDEIRRARYERLAAMGLIDPAWEPAPRPEQVPAWNTLPEAEQAQWDHEMAVYAAQVERMDAGIGRLLDALGEKGVEENTLIVFLSDNGGAAEDPNGSLAGAVLGTRDSFEGYGLRGAHVSCAPFRLTKKYIHEGGIATPFIVRWPARIAGGGVRRQTAHLIDVMPTFLEAAGAAFPETRNGAAVTALEGVSLMPAFAGKELPERSIFWEHEGNRGVREGKWKLVSRYRGPWELYDMAADRTELHDLSAAEPERLGQMAARYERWAEQVGARPWELIEQAKK